MKDHSLPFEDSIQGITFQSEIALPEIPDHKLIEDWIYNIVAQESRKLKGVSFVFVNDKSLLQINKTHLKHDTLTDIITFPYSTDPVEGEIYISVQRVRDNAKKYGVTRKQELLRVIAHGILHLCGWQDKTAHEASLMRKRENACLALIGL